MQSSRFIFIGIEQSGTKTLLNAFTGKRQFLAPVNGQTHDGATYLKPSSSNEEQDQFRQELTKLLNREGPQFIFFVITLTSEGIHTVKRVLESFPQIGNRYSLIVTKLQPTELNQFATQKADFLARSYEGFPRHQISNSLFLFPYDESAIHTQMLSEEMTMKRFREFVTTSPCYSAPPRCQQPPPGATLIQKETERLRQQLKQNQIEMFQLQERIASNPRFYNYQYEGITGWVFPPGQVPGTTPLLRYINGYEHLYTIHPEEIGTTTPGEKGNHGILFEGDACWVFGHPGHPGTFPLYRYFGGPHSEHLYTLDPNEIGVTEPGRPGKHGYVCEGVACWIHPQYVEGAIPLYRYWNGHDHLYTTNAYELA